jgi:large subunit ribosomal protein L3
LDHVQALDTFKCGNFLIQNLGISHKSPHQTHPAQLKYFKECGTAPKLKVHGFKISEGAQVEKGKFIYAAHFVAGQYIDVIGKR